MIHCKFAISLLIAVICWIGLPIANSQCPAFTASSIEGADGTLCEGASVTLSASAQDIPAGSFLNWYIGSNPVYNPYTGQGTLIGSVPIEMTCNNDPEVLYIMVNPDNTQVGSSDDKCDEFMVLWTGSGGFSTSDISVTNLGNGTFFWNDFVVGNAASFSCGTALPPGPVPPNSILIIQGSPTNNVFVDIDNLCATGLPVYIIANNNTDCTGGFFDNNSPCSSCPVMIDITGSCTADINLDYMPPPGSLDGWAWANTGSGVYADVVPPLNIPAYSADETIIDDFTWTIPDDFCETMAGGNWYITGILSPPPSGACPDIFTDYFLLNISCPELSLSGGGDVCTENCPDNPTEILFNIIGDDVPFTVDILITISIFPPFPINDLQISDGQKIFVCMGGFFPSFDPSTGILQVPDLAVGITATVTIVSGTSASGCIISMDQNSITLNFIAAPTADAGNDIEICPGDDVTLNGDIGGSATESEWTTDGDGDFSDPTDLNAIYTPGTLDISNGSVILTLTSMDPNGSCSPAESSITVTFLPVITIDLGPPLTVCDNDVVNLMVMMTGGNVDGEWNSSGDGVFDDPSDPTTIYSPGTGDFSVGSVTLSFEVTDPDACIGTNAPLNVTFVHAPDVAIPQDIEICDDEIATVEISITGSFANVSWTFIGDGQLDIINDTLVSYTPGPNDILDGIAIVTVTVESVFPECGQTTYNIPITVTLCNCPDFETSPPTSPLCSENDMLDLTSLFVEGGSGEWSISSNPGGSNPATINGTIFTTNFSDPGIYTVTYTLDNPQTGCPFSSSEMIVVNDVIIPDAGPDVDNCGPGAIAVIGFPNLTPPATYLWESLGDGSFSNNTSQAAIYTPGTNDSISTDIFLVLHILDPVCGNQTDTLGIHFYSPPFALFTNDTFSICNESDKGSIINFSSLIISGDQTGTWTNTSGAPVDFSNPSSVDFDGVPEGNYAFTYQTNSAIAPCQDVTYTIIIEVEQCLCPLLAVQPIPGICNSQSGIDLNAFVMAGAPGTWVILNAPPGSNPATVVGSILNPQGADPGDYELRFSFNSGPIDGCPDSAEIVVFIQDQPHISLFKDTSVCGITDIPISAIISGSATNVMWSTTGSGMFSQNPSLNSIYSPTSGDLALGQVLIYGHTIDTFGFCPLAKDTISLSLETPPYTNWSSLNTVICNDPDSGSVVNLTSFIIGGDSSGNWTDVDGSQVNLSDPSNVDFDGTSTGTYHFSYLTQSAAPPCIDTEYIFSVVVIDCSCPALIVGSIPQEVCEGTSIDLNALAIDVAPGAWAVYSGPFGTWPVIVGNNVNTANADAGNYTLRYLLTDSVPGCNASAFVPFTLENAPSIFSSGFSCDPVAMTYSVNISTDAVTINSNFGIVVQNSQGHFTVHSIPDGQDVTIELVSLSGGCNLFVPFAAPDCACTLMAEDISDTIFVCPGDTFVLIPFLTGAQGLAFSTWISDNATLHRPTLPIYEANTWIWIVKDSIGCEIRDTFDAALRELIVIDADSIPPSCEGMTDGSIIINDIDGGIGPYTVQVDGNQPFISTTFPDTISNIGVGAHSISATNLDGCETILPMNIESNSTGAVDLGSDVTVPIGDSVFIDPILNGINAATIEWVPGIHPPILESFWYLPSETTLLSITVTDSAGCIYTDEKLITVTIERHFYIPTIFSPNGDQINDVLQVETSSNPIDIRSLEIFDRWGNMLYRQLESPPFSWDGTYKNENVPAGVYVIKLIWKDDLGNDQFYISDLTLIR